MISVVDSHLTATLARGIGYSVISTVSRWPSALAARHFEGRVEEVSRQREREREREFYQAKESCIEHIEHKARKPEESAWVEHRK